MTLSATTRARRLGVGGLAVLSGAVIALTAAALPSAAAPQQHAKPGPHTRTHSAVQRGTRTSRTSADITSPFTSEQVRLVDTRVDEPTGPVAGLVQTLVADDVPGGTTVELTVTAVTPSGSGHISAYADGDATPVATNVNYGIGVTTSNTIVVTVPDSGKIDLNVVGASTQLIVDQKGYFSAATLTGTSPLRIGDSRIPVGFSRKGTQSGVVTLAIPADAVPDDSGTLALNVTTQSPTSGGGYVRVYSGGTPPTTSALNYGGGVVTNLVFVTPAANGTVSFDVIGTPTNLVVDLDGYAPADSEFTATTPVRVLDTRQPPADPEGPVNGAGDVQVLPAPAAGSTVPAGTAVAVTVTTVNQTGFGFTVSFSGDTEPAVSELQYRPGPPIAQTIVVPVNPDGTITIDVHHAPTDLVVDREGIIVPSAT